MELILGIIILVFAIWETQLSGWIIIIAAIVLILHSKFCMHHEVPEMKETKKKKRRR